MPCICHESEIEKKQRVDVKTSRLEAENADMKLHLDKVTRLLCFVIEKMKKFADNKDTESEASDKIYGILQNKELSEWYNKHQEADRLALQKVKEKALAKLSNEEKKALGL